MRWNEEASQAAFTSLNRVLAKCVLQGERPIFKQIYKEAGVSTFQRRINNKYNQRFKKRFERVDSKWLKSGGSDYKKLKAELEKILDEDKKPSEGIVGRRAGYGSILLDSYAKKFPNHKTFLWRKKLAKEIKEGVIIWEKNKEQNRLNNLKRQCHGETPSDLYDKYIQNTQDIEEYKNIKIKYDHMTISIDLGAYMFKDYKNLESFTPKRKPLLDAIIKLAYSYLDKSPVTGESMTRRFLRFLKFVYDNNLPLPIEPNNARYVAQEYRNYCINSKTSQNTNAINFNLTLICFKHLFENPDVYAKTFKGIKKIKRQDKKNSTYANIDDVGYAISYYYNFFTKVSDFIFEKKSFPYKLTLNGKETLLVPFNKRFFITKDTLSNNISWQRYIDFDNGKLRSEKDMLQNIQFLSPDRNSKSNHTKSDYTSEYTRYLKKRKAIIDDANSNHLHEARLELAQRAFKAFYMLFAAFTGMKDSELASFEWPDDEKIESTKSTIMNVAVIKPRANYKEIHLTINRIGVPLFKKALKLRKYLLQGNTCPKFFFTGYLNQVDYGTTLTQGNYGSQCISRHKVAHPNLPMIGTKKLRVFKNKMVLSITKGDMWLASASIGNSLRVNAEHYQGESEEKKDTQLNYFVENMVRQLKEYDNETITPQGKCESHNNPESINEGETLNCNNPFDCFKCKHYYATTDQETIHKLISLQYIIKRIQSKRAYNDIHFDEIMRPIEKKIERILIAMAIRYDLGNILNEITTLVFKKEILHPYWAFRLHHLFAIHQI